MTEEDWATWIYQADITSGTGDGDATFTVTAGVGNEAEILYAQLFNGDTVTRVVQLIIDDGTNEFDRLLDTNCTAGARQSWPVINEQADGGTTAGPGRYLIAGPMRLVATIVGLGSTDDVAFSLTCRINAGVPTVVEAASGTETVNINVEQVV